MAAAPKQEKTKTPGVYKRGDRYSLTFRDAGGKQRWESVRTYDEARTLKRTRDQQTRDGETHVLARDQVTLAQYALDLFGADLARADGAPRVLGRYQGRNGAIRDATKADYRRDVEVYWLPLLGSKRLPALTAPDIAKALATLAAREGDAYLADRSLRRLFAPLSALMATAVEEGVIRHNVARDVRVPSGRDRLAASMSRIRSTTTATSSRTPARRSTRSRRSCSSRSSGSSWCCSPRRVCGSARRSHCAGATCSSTAAHHTSRCAAHSSAESSARRSPGTAGATCRSATGS